MVAISAGCHVMLAAQCYPNRPRYIQSSTLTRLPVHSWKSSLKAHARRRGMPEQCRLVLFAFSTVPPLCFQPLQAPGPTVPKRSHHAPRVQFPVVLLHAPSAPQVTLGEPMKFVLHTPVQVLPTRLLVGQLKAPFRGLAGGVVHAANTQSR